VWMAPGSRWRRRYDGWRALRKLEYVDEMMQELSRKAPANKSREHVERLREIKITLREYYEKKHRHYDFQWPPDYDRDLLRIFSSDASSNSRRNSSPTAASFLRRHRREFCAEVADGTGVHSYAIDQMYAAMINRCRDLKLRLHLTEKHARQKVLVLLTVQTMNGIHTGYHRIAL
jgi:hypothetical protein